MNLPAPTSLVVLTQNAWGGAPLWNQRAQRLVRAIAELRPDIVGLQEIHAASEGGESQAHDLARRIGGYEAIFAPGRITERGHCEGVALLVRSSLAIVNHSVQALSVDASDFLDAPHQRVVLAATLRLDVTIDVLVTHLSLSKRARDRTVPEVVAFADGRRKRTGSAFAVLMGDLNATPNEASLAALRSGSWVDAWEHGNPKRAGATWPSALPLRRLDYLWTQLGGGVTIPECRRSPLTGSDHLGLWAKIAWASGPVTGCDR